MSTENRQLVVIPYRSAVSDPILNGEKYTNAFRINQAGDNIILATYILIESSSEVEVYHVEIPLAKGQTKDEFEKDFSESLVNLSFKDAEGGIGGFKIIRDPIMLGGNI